MQNHVHVVRFLICQRLAQEVKHLVSDLRECKRRCLNERELFNKKCFAKQIKLSPTTEILVGVRSV